MPGFYIHVPFCARKCPYCDFYSLPLEDGSDALSVYLRGIRMECSRLPRGFTPETLYMGGGTPSVLSESALRELVECVRAATPAAAEWTVEANPGTLDRAKALLLKDAGVNRVSLGAQSLNDSILERLGRIHSADETRRACDLLRDAGFDNINLDLMYGVPEQTVAELEADVEQFLHLSPAHISCYAFSFEPGTPFDQRRREGRLTELPDSAQRAQYDLIRERLHAAGYVHYEISNFAKPGCECRHNVNYWKGGAYVGCGPAAHSHWEGARWGNVRDLGEWARRLERGESPREFEERLPVEAKARETLILNLRLLEGVTRDAFRTRTGMDYWELAGDAIARLISEGWLVEGDGRLRLAEEALFVSNAVFSELV